MSGKGSKQRPTDKQKFDESFDRIFGKSKKPKTTEFDADKYLDTPEVKAEFDKTDGGS